jgi:hypothetical protein
MDFFILTATPNAGRAHPASRLNSDSEDWSINLGRIVADVANHTSGVLYVSEQTVELNSTFVIFRDPLELPTLQM